MYKAWITKAAKQPMALETVDPGPLGLEDVEVAVDHCGLCHSDLSVFNNDWGISQYPAIPGHEVVGRGTAIGPNAKRVQVGQHVGIGWFSASDIRTSSFLHRVFRVSGVAQQSPAGVERHCPVRADDCQPRRSPVSARLNGVPILFVVSDTWELPRLQENWYVMLSRPFGDPEHPAGFAGAAKA